MRWVPPTPRTVVGIAPQAMQMGETCLPLEDPTYAENLRLRARALENDAGEPIAVFGADIFWPGVAHGWALLSDEARDHPIHLVRGARRWIAVLFRQEKLRRLAITIRRDFPAARTFALALGFKYEGTFLHYGPDGSDHDGYARYG